MDIHESDPSNQTTTTKEKSWTKSWMLCIRCHHRLFLQCRPYLHHFSHLRDLPTSCVARIVAKRGYMELRIRRDNRAEVHRDRKQYNIYSTSNSHTQHRTDELMRTSKTPSSIGAMLRTLLVLISSPLPSSMLPIHGMAMTHAFTPSIIAAHRFPTNIPSRTVNKHALGFMAGWQSPLPRTGMGVQMHATPRKQSSSSRPKPRRSSSSANAKSYRSTKPPLQHLDHKKAPSSKPTQPSMAQQLHRRHAEPVQQTVICTLNKATNTMRLSLDPPLEDIIASDDDVPSTQQQRPDRGIPESISKPPIVLDYEERLKQIQTGPKPKAKTIDDYLSQIPSQQQEQLHPNIPTNADELILYHDDAIVVVNKPPGVPCVPDMKNSPNLLEWVHARFGQDSPSPASMSVHRLDRDTSGVLIYGRTLDVTRTLDETFRLRQVQKTYQALLHGALPHDIEIDLPLQRDPQYPPFTCVATHDTYRTGQNLAWALKQAGYRKQMGKYRGKSSCTTVRVVDGHRVELQPHTGRNHQLRVHCAAVGYPIVGDTMYGWRGDSADRGGMAGMEFPEQWKGVEQPIDDDGGHDESSTLCLHAASLTLAHPVTKEVMTWEAPVPF